MTLDYFLKQLPTKKKINIETTDCKNEIEIWAVQNDAYEGRLHFVKNAMCYHKTLLTCDTVQEVEEQITEINSDLFNLNWENFKSRKELKSKIFQFEKALDKAVNFMAQCTYCPIEYTRFCTDKDCKKHLINWLMENG